MSNLSSTGARDRGHQIGCPAMRDSTAWCTCDPQRRPAGAEEPRVEHWPAFANDLYVGVFEPGEQLPWYVWVLAVIAILLACGFIYWIGGFQR